MVYMRARLVLCLAMLVVLGGVAACESESGGGDESPAVQACYDFVETFCERANECTGWAESECEAQVESDLHDPGGCSSMVELRAAEDVPSCISQVEEATCEELVAFGSGAEPLPAECQGQFLYQD